MDMSFMGTAEFWDNLPVKWINESSRDDHFFAEWVYIDTNDRDEILSARDYLRSWRKYIMRKLENSYEFGCDCVSYRPAVGEIPGTLSLKISCRDKQCVSGNSNP